jgi:hypothetical protein
VRRPISANFSTQKAGRNLKMREIRNGGSVQVWNADVLRVEPELAHRLAVLRSNSGKPVFYTWDLYESIVVNSKKM